MVRFLLGFQTVMYITPCGGILNQLTTVLRYAGTRSIPRTNKEFTGSEEKISVCLRKVVPVKVDRLIQERIPAM